MNKKTGEINELTDCSYVNRPRKLMKLESIPDAVVTWYEPEIREAHIGIFNLETKQYTEIDSGHCMELLCTKGHYIVYFQKTTRGSAPNKLFIYDTVTSKIRIVSDPPQDAHYDNLAEISEGNLYFTGWQGDSRILYRVPLEGDLAPEIICSIGSLSTRYFAMKIQGTILFLMHKNNDYAFIYRSDLKELEAKKPSEDEENSADNSIPYDPFALIKKIRKNRPPFLQETCVVGENEHISGDMAFYDDILLYGDKESGFLEMLKWDGEEKVRLVSSGVYCESFGYGTPFIRLGDWVYFRRASNGTYSSDTYKVHLDSPLQVEKVRR